MSQFNVNFHMGVVKTARVCTDSENYHFDP